ncbi:hypothetical protein [Sulfurivermis fontis]|uniref:hypothetical protein n=1 Tax=Sulfurivermis fontis TaxID=1972068 RepID=UPI000FD898E3|nr:hypothetical protein [Sulfurivermis fontis]
MERPAPPWLNDEDELRALLGRVLDRFDQQPGAERQQRTYLAAEKHLPTLARGDADADQLWRFVRTLESWGVCTVVPNKRRGPYDPEWSDARLAFAPQAEDTLRAWLDRPREEPAIRAWRAAVAQHAAAFPGGIEPLLKRRIAIPGWSDDEVVTALARSGTFRAPLTLRQLSARIFRGDSKRLDEREDLIRALFPQLPLKPRPLVVAVYLPETCRGVLFIENQDSYAAALAGAWPATADLALVYAAGFRGGAERIRERGAALLHYAGSDRDSGTFEAWWFDGAATPGPLHFFGDLDFAGMAILAALRQRFGAVNAWQPGYAALLERLHAGHGHAALDADKQLQTDPGRTGCPYADEILLPAARRLGFVDQEAMD